MTPGTKIDPAMRLVITPSQVARLEKEIDELNADLVALALFRAARRNGGGGASASGAHHQPARRARDGDADGDRGRASRPRPRSPMSIASRIFSSSRRASSIATRATYCGSPARQGDGRPLASPRIATRLTSPRSSRATSRSADRRSRPSPTSQPAVGRHQRGEGQFAAPALVRLEIKLLDEIIGEAVMRRLAESHLLDARSARARDLRRRPY